MQWRLLKKNSDSIHKLTTLVSKLNMDKRETQYKPKFIRVGIEAKIEIGKTIINLRTDPLVGIKINPTIEAEEVTIGTIIGPIIEIGQNTTIGIMVEETTMDQMIGMTITDQMIGETITDKTIEGTITEIDKLWKRQSTDV